MGDTSVTNNPGPPTLPEWQQWIETHDLTAGYRLLGLALRHWRQILLVTVLGAAAGLGFVLMNGKIFTATAQIEIATTEHRVVRVDSVMTDLGTDRGVIDGQIELMRSASLARRLIKELGLFKGKTVASATEPGATPVAGGPPLGIADELVELFLANLKVERVGQTFLVDITYQGANAQETAAVANAIGKTYIQQNQLAKIEATREANRWLQAQIDQMRDKVRAAEQRVLQFRIDHNLIQVGAVSLNEVEIGEYSKNVITARTAMLKASARVRQLDLIGADKNALRGLDFILESKQISEMEKQFADLKNKQADIKARFGATHPDVANTQDQLNYIDGQIDAEVQRIIAGVRQSYEIAKKEVVLFDEDFTKLKTDVSRHNFDTSELGELERDLEATRSLYVNFLTRLKETTAEESLPSERAIFVSEAYAPTRSTRPKAMLYLAGATIAGLMLGCLLALLRAAFTGGWLQAPGARQSIAGAGRLA